MFETLGFGGVVRLMGRVAGETLAQQAVVLGAYGALVVIVLGGFELSRVSGIFGLIAMAAGLILLAFMAAAPSVLAALMAPRAAQIVSGDLDTPVVGIPWRRLPAIMWASFALSWLVSFMAQLFLVPGLIALAALWAWPLVAACEPGAVGISRAQELVKGRKGTVMTWFLGLGLCLMAPLMFAIILGAYALGGSDRHGAAMALVLMLGAGLLAGACVVIQASFWATVYGVLRRDEQRGEMDELLQAFD